MGLLNLHRRLTAPLVTAFIAAREAAGYSPRTLDGYRYALNPLANAYPHLPTDPAAIGKFLIQWKNLTTRATRHQRLCAFYRWLVEDGRIKVDENPMPRVQPPRVKRKFARSLTVDELQRLFAYPHKTEMRLFLLLLIDAGLRRDEAFRLMPEDVTDRSVIVTAKGGDQREVPVSPPIRNLLRQHLPWPWTSVESAGQLVRRAFRQAGLNGKRASAHTLRVTWTRLAKMDKVNKKAAGGWATWTMLEHYLGDITDETVEQHRTGTPLRLLE